MTLSTKQVGSALFVALGLAVYVGCGAPPPASEGERVGAAAEALGAVSSTWACVDSQIGTAKWLVNEKCGCNYTGAQQDQCVYELGVLTCLKQAGYALNCNSLPPLAIVSVVANDPNKFLADFEDVDFNVYLPKNCRAQQTASLCVKQLNTQNGPSGTPYVKPTVSASLLDHCAPAIDVCNDYPPHADFDPCSIKQCVPKQ